MRTTRHESTAPRPTGARPPARPGCCAPLLALLFWLCPLGVLVAAPNIAVWRDLQTSQGPWAVPPVDLTNAVAVAGGWYHVLALREDGTISGWGDDLATEVPPQLTNVVAVAAGWLDSVALQPGGLVTAWGTTQQVRPMFHLA